MDGTFWGIGVGPGDPELLTLKALRVLQAVDVVSAPGPVVENTLAYRIAVQAVPALSEKPLLPLPMPMTRDTQTMAAAHRENSQTLLRHLSAGKDVGFLTLGDPTLYSTVSYLAGCLERQGCKTAYVSGVPSFCAAAARACLSLCSGQEALHIFPADRAGSFDLRPEDTYVFLKGGRSLRSVKDALAETGREAVLVEHCGLPTEQVYPDLDQMPEEAPYLSLLIAKGKTAYE